MARNCYDCGAPTRRERKDYKYTECGLPDVTLKNLTVHVCRECGAEMPEIPNMAGLHRAILAEVISKRTLLSGEEIRFLRRVGRLKASELAKLIGITPEHLSRCENNKKTIGTQADRVLRLICYVALLERILKPDEDSRSTLANLASIPKLDLRDLLTGISERVGKPKRVTIDPSVLSARSQLLAVQ